MSVNTLAQVPIGASVRVINILGSDALQQRIMEMGLLPGIDVKVLRQAPMGDPIEVRVLGYNLSLRREEAAHVEVESKVENKVENTGDAK
jgi:Fe2+ transport system protein FeoA